MSFLLFVPDYGIAVFVVMPIIIIAIGSFAVIINFKAFSIHINAARVIFPFVFTAFI